MSKAKHVYNEAKVFLLFCGLAIAILFFNKKRAISQN